MQPGIRPFETRDRAQVEALAIELTAGVAPWRSQDEVRAAVRDWVEESMADAGPDRPVWVAEVAAEVVGFVTARSSVHWSGQTDAYVGELVVAPAARRRGVAGRLLAQVEEWAREQGVQLVRVPTGAANHAALGMYAQAGYQTEDVVLTKRVRPVDVPAGAPHPITTTWSYDDVLAAVRSTLTAARSDTWDYEQADLDGDQVLITIRIGDESFGVGYSLAELPYGVNTGCVCVTPKHWADEIRLDLDEHVDTGGVSRAERAVRPDGLVLLRWVW